MPRVKIDYIVSVSSEDPDHPANNLLAGEVSKKKWLCGKGEQSCSVVLQLHHAVTISTVNIGVHQAAFVEVLVGTSERPDAQYEVLVPRCMFMGPGESRRFGGGAGPAAGERVRSFSADQLAEGARRRRWDRVRLLCSQPYNKHCQFGLSFIQIYEPEGVSADSTSAEPRPVCSALAAPGLKDKFLALGSYSSDEDEFRPGELFAKHRQSLKPNEDAAHGCTGNTDAQIRQASTRALKNISDSDTRLKKTPIARSSSKREESGEKGGRRPADRGRRGLMYEPEDDRPDARIDRVLERHKVHKDKAQSIADDADSEKQKNKSDNNVKKVNEDEFSRRTSTHGVDEPSGSRTNQQEKKRDSSNGQQKDTLQENRKRQRSEDDLRAAGTHQTGGLGASSKLEREVLRGVVFAMSGYVNPERAALRAAGLELGARYRPDWTPDCTHLVCAFPNTPKLKKVVASAPHAQVVSGDWLRACRQQGRRLPEAPHSLHPRAAAPATGTPASATGPSAPAARTPAPASCPKTRPESRASWEPHAADSADTDDTDDEIEKVRARSKRPRVAAAPRPTPAPPTSSSDNDVSFVCDERFKGSVTLSDSDEDVTEEEAGAGEKDEEGPAGDELPDFLEGLSFVVSGDAAAAGFDARLLARYVRAYGGLLLQEAEVEEGGAVDYVLCGAAGQEGAVRVRGLRVRADWLWACHSLRALAPTLPYELPC